MNPVAEVLDLSVYLRPGDMVVWGQACAEPQTLTEMLVEQRPRLPGLRCFVGIPASTTLVPEHGDWLGMVSYCGTGMNQRLHEAGSMDILPVHYSSLPALLSGGPLAADVVFVQVSAPDEQGRHSLGLADDYFSAAISTARVVIAEINDQVPFTFGSRTMTSADWTMAVQSSRRPAELRTAEASPVMDLVAEQVASLIDDGSTLQFGIGGLPEVVLARLGDRRDLGIHSGIINEAAMDLIRRGVVTGARKSVDTGVAVAGLLVGTEKLFRFAHRNAAVELRSTGYTHNAEVLAAQHQLVAINSALEVDLSGQVNAEELNGRYVGAVGGATDFLRGAAKSRGGLPVVALPSESRGVSRIVAELNGPVSTLRGDAGVFVTEYGTADLRGLPLNRRYERMLQIAHPRHREALAAELDSRLIAASGPRRSESPRRSEGPRQSEGLQRPDGAQQSEIPRWSEGQQRPEKRSQMERREEINRSALRAGTPVTQAPA